MTSGGLKVYHQKRLILCNIRELFHLYREYNPNDKIGLSSFAMLRPKHCVLAGSTGTHTVCVCAMHQNIKLMMIGMLWVNNFHEVRIYVNSCISLLFPIIIDSNLKTLTRDTRYPLDHYSNCIDFKVCYDTTPECYLRTCKHCPRIDTLHSIIKNALVENDIDMIYCKQWISKPRSSLGSMEMEVDEFTDVFCEKMIELLPHTFVAKEQGNYCKELRESLEDGEFLVICDFAENYAFVVQNAAPGFHWNNDQATIYTIVVYYRNNSSVTHESFAIISDHLSHDTVTVHVNTKRLINFIKTIDPNPRKIYYFSDGAPSQFKNLKNFINISYHHEDYGVDAE